MKVIDAGRAAELIEDRQTVYVGGFGAYSSPDDLMRGLASRYAKEGHPKELTVISGICSGFGNIDDIGHNIMKAEGLIGTIIAGHFMIAGQISRMVGENRVAAYALPLGAIADMLRAGASGQPGVLKKVGLGTYVDPRVSGCWVNDKAEKQKDRYSDLVRYIELDDEEYLLYKSLRPEICLIRGSYADEDGNISMKREALYEYQLETVMATKNSGGTVIVQVEKMVKNGDILPKEVRIPGIMVDYVVAASAENHRQMNGSDKYDPALSGECRVPEGDIMPMPLDIRKVIARRAAMELKKIAGEKTETVVNLGIGLPAGVGLVAAEEGLKNLIISLETGPVGGIPLDGAAFAGAVNHKALMHAADVFAFYDGGGLDIAFLGAAEIDKNGNVNVSKFGSRCAGPGGFINITQNTHALCFMGKFMTGSQDIRAGGGRLTIIKDGTASKIVKNVQQVTFSGTYAEKTGQDVLYITERAVFRLDENGCLELTETAPGVDIENDILKRMTFAPKISPDLKEMDEKIFW